MQKASEKPFLHKKEAKLPRANLNFKLKSMLIVRFIYLNFFLDNEGPLPETDNNGPLETNTDGPLEIETENDGPLPETDNDGPLPQQTIHLVPVSEGMLQQQTQEEEMNNRGHGQVRFCAIQ